MVIYSIFELLYFYSKIILIQVFTKFHTFDFLFISETPATSCVYNPCKQGPKQRHQPNTFPKDRIYPKSRHYYFSALEYDDMLLYVLYTFFYFVLLVVFVYIFIQMDIKILF